MPASPSTARASRDQPLRPARSGRRQQQHDQVRRQRRAIGLGAAAIALALAVLIAARVLAPSANAPEGPVPPDVLASIANVSPAVLDQVGQGTARALPAPVRASTVALGPNGKPLVTYIGAEYCPFCAAERWSLVVALSRFGQFENLKASHSASDDVFPNTPTFSFVGATYTSQYVDFSPVELQSNVKSGGAYNPLQTPTPDQERLLRQYDVPPYVPANSAGAIPFIDIADQYVLSGSSFDVGVLRGQTMESIAQSLADPGTPTAQAILGGANALTAAICEANGNTPGDVCGLAAVKNVESQLASTPSPAGR
ncbi:MAG TPA: DUF929 family protein [Chloroflexota bacterium]|nr:DUF929 family protein [Chloroflexota bacterium]